MSAKPTVLTRWAQTAGGVVVTGSNAPVTPNSGKLDVGFAPGEKPPAGFLNWLFNNLYLWLLFLNDSPQFVPTTTNAPGLGATGNGTGTGLAGTGGATSGAGMTGTGGAPNGNGVVGNGTGTGSGGSFTGGASNGNGVVGTGIGTGDGVTGNASATAGSVGVMGNGAASAATGTNGGAFFGGAGTTNGAGGKGLTGTGGAGAGTGISGDGGTFTGGTSAGTGAHGTGAVFVAGGGGAPARGALSLTSQTAPTAPSNGDVWYDGTSLFARIAGISKRLSGGSGTLLLSGTCGQSLGTTYLALIGYVTIGFTLNAAGIASFNTYRFPFAVRIINMRIAWHILGPTGGNEVLQPLVNGAVAGTAFTIAAGVAINNAGIDTAQNITVPAGQGIGVQQTVTGGSTTNPTDVVIQLDYEIV